MTRPDGAAPVTALARGLALGLLDGGMAPAGVVGVGVDAVDLARFAPGARPPAGSWPTASSPPASWPTPGRRPTPVPRLSTRFAAKEAVMKALGVGLGAYPFHDVEVVRAGLDAPGLVLTGAAASLAHAHRRGPLAPVAHPHRSGGRGPGGGRGCVARATVSPDRPATS